MWLPIDNEKKIVVQCEKVIPMTLCKKTLLIIGVMIAGLIVIVYVILQIILLSSFSKLEKQNTQQNVERALDALSNDLFVLDVTCDNWASWDDTYAFIKDANGEYVKSNLIDGTFIKLRLNLILFVNSSGQIVFGKAFDLQNETEIPIPQSLQELLSANEILLYHPNTESHITGIVLLSEGPMLISSQPILTSEDKGPIHGALIMGRYLTFAEIERLSKITHLPLTIYQVNNPQMPSDFQEARSSLSEKTPIFVQALSAESIAGYALLKDIYGKPGLMLRVDIPRRIYKQSQVSQRFFILLFLVISLVFTVMVILFLKKQILSRLTLLNHSVKSISKSGDFTTRIQIKGKDELSSLAGEINRMLETLEHSCYKLRESEEKYRSLVKSTEDSMYLVDRNCRYLFLNKKYLSRIGLPKEKVVGKTYGEFHSKEDTKEMREKVEEAFETGKFILYEYRNRRNNRYFLRTLNPIKDPKTGIVKAITVVSKDITKYKKIKEELKKSEEQLRRIFDASNEVIFTKDIKGYYTHANAAFSRILKRPLEKIIGKKDEEIFLEKEAKILRKTDLKVLERGDTDTHEDILTVDKERRVFKTTKVPLRNEAGEIVGLCGFAEDITERKQREEKIRYISFHDALTGAYNRNFFKEEMKRLNTQRNYPLSIVIVDINSLKFINDTIGHIQGDKLLKILVQILKSVSRKEDIVARIGGDEFVIILPRTDENVAQVFCDRVRNKCREHNRKAIHQLSIALGYATQSAQYEDIEEVLKRADKNMYTEKLSQASGKEKYIIDTFKTILTIKDPHAEKHTKRMENLLEALGRNLELSEAELNKLKLLALLHDIGKIVTPDSILFKPGKLNEEEWKIMKKHSEEGYKIAKNIPQLFSIAEGILYHHERWDGKGYPRGLKGEKIPLISRIVFIVDAYDAMLSDRPYRKALSKKEVVEEIKKGAGTQFDPKLAERFLKIVEKN